MRKELPIAATFLPLVIAIGMFKLAPTSSALAWLLSGSFFLGWIATGFTPIRQRWLKVLLVLAYPVVMLIAILVIAVAEYGIPGGPF